MLFIYLFICNTSFEVLRLTMHVHTTVYLFTFKTLGAFFKLKFTCYHIILNMPVPSIMYHGGHVEPRLDWT